MIDEMRKENLKLLKHISSVDSKSSLDYNIFVINKFLVKESNTYWWKRLKEEHRVLTSTRPIRTDHIESFFKNLKKGCAKLLGKRHT